ncbi:TIGR02587 family membrane protein [Devosia nitrariae]|uniref:Membrane protein n=1 Tax=Devosia nitrariae TaxID=2071872 RepID=A0ABQ5W071_9HYPH|nr:TIGR02587 family membrane protein [Devosia nitrariae]GLQ53065.1 membrane protein [Devosia nitrariae]
MADTAERLPADETLRPLLIGFGRAFGGALIFSLPMLMTMEMWQLGFTMSRWRLVALLAISVPLLVFLSRYSGFESTRHWREDVRDVLIALGIGAVSSTTVLFLLAVLDTSMPPSEIIGKIALQTVPAALGALLGRSQLGQNGQSGEQRETYGGELAIMAIGALFLGLNLAPTEEMLLISLKMTAFHCLVLVPVSVMIMHAFVYASAFKGGSEIEPGTPWWSAFLRFTVVGYAVALLVSAYVLWTFGRFDGLAFERALRVTVVLAFPAAVGAAAARLIL